MFCLIVFLVQEFSIPFELIDVIIASEFSSMQNPIISSQKLLKHATKYNSV